MSSVMSRRRSGPLGSEVLGRLLQSTIEWLVERRVGRDQFAVLVVQSLLIVVGAFCLRHLRLGRQECRDLIESDVSVSLDCFGYRSGGKHLQAVENAAVGDKTVSLEQRAQHQIPDLRL